MYPGGTLKVVTPIWFRSRVHRATAPYRTRSQPYANQADKALSSGAVRQPPADQPSGRSGRATRVPQPERNQAQPRSPTVARTRLDLHQGNKQVATGLCPGASQAGDANTTGRHFGRFSTPL
jgi:hypothetical protein